MKTFILILFCLPAFAQHPIGAKFDSCIHWEIHRGKELYNKKYCTAWEEFTQTKQGLVKLSATFSGSSMSALLYEQYIKLSDRGKIICDSLQDDGLPDLDYSHFLIYEYIYMKEPKKFQRLYAIRGNEVVVYTYLLKKRLGAEFIEMITIK